MQTSDVHLGATSREPTGRVHEWDCVCPIEVLAAEARANDVDVVLIAGDLFDHARVSEQLVVDTFTHLAKLAADFEVVLLPGNHDVLDPNDERALYRRHRSVVDGSGILFVDSIDGVTLELAGGALALWARAMDDHSPQYVPLASPPVHPGDRWYVVAGHGHFVPESSGPRGESYRSSRITIEHIDATGADYVALGHWHLMTDLSAHGVRTPAWYCGAPLFGHGAGQMLLVDLVPDAGVSVTPIGVLDHAAASCPRPVE